MMAHNLSKELQMISALAASRALPKRPVAWKFKLWILSGIKLFNEPDVSHGLKENLLLP
jgi:hypothetical protein